MTRSEHLEWAKERAREQADKTSSFAAWIGFKHDLQKHDELKDHIAIFLGDEIIKGFAPLMLKDPVRAIKIFDGPGPQNIRKFIEDFN